MKTQQQSQEREDEMAEQEYHIDQIVEAEPDLPEMNWKERAFWCVFVAATLLLTWLGLRGFYLAAKELIRWL